MSHMCMVGHWAVLTGQLGGGEETSLCSEWHILDISFTSDTLGLKLP